VVVVTAVGTGVSAVELAGHGPAAELIILANLASVRGAAGCCWRADYHIPCALKNVDYLDHLLPKAVEAQVIAVNAAANPEALVASHQRVGPGVVGQSLAAIQQLLGEADGPSSAAPLANGRAPPPLWAIDAFSLT